MRPAVLFARRDSIYKKLDCDVWDEDRNALNWPGFAPVVAHPPCRSWGNLRNLANPAPGEKELAIFAVEQVRRFGGVLEHPVTSQLWAECALAPPGQYDDFGVFTYPIQQFQFGHRAAKRTNLYIVGLASSMELTTVPFALGESPCVCCASGRRRNGSRLLKGMHGWRPEVRKEEREQTPPLLAKWLLDVAMRCAS